MTSVLPEEESKAARLKQKLMNDGPAKEESRSFLSFSRENLSISNAELEQGFHRHRLRPSRNTILSAVGLIVGLTCLGLEAWQFHSTLANAREIEGLKRDVESLKHRFVEEDLVDGLKAFEEQLNAEESNDGEDDPGEADIENADYDSYDEDVSSSQEYFGDYQAHPTYGSRPSDFPDSSSTIQPVPSPPEPSSNKALVEFLATLRKVEAKRGQEFEKSAREGHRSIEHRKRTGHEEKTRETNGTRHRRDASDEAAGQLEVLDGRGRNQTRRSRQDDVAKRNQTVSINVWERHPPKKYYTHARPDAGQSPLSSRRENSNVQAVPSDKRSSRDPDERLDRGFNWRNGQDDVEELAELRRAIQSSPTSVQPRRGVTRRHLRAPRQVYAVHYGADSTLFSEDDEHTGNGRARHSNGVFKAWRPSDWVADLGMSRYFSLADGRLTVHEPGLYLVYAQIHYLDEHDENGFHVLVNGRPILQCMIYSPGVGHKSRSCFSAQVTILQTGDHLTLKDVGSARYTLFQQDKSFFGLVKLGDPRQQQRHQTPQPAQ